MKLGGVRAGEEVGLVDLFDEELEDAWVVETIEEELVSNVRTQRIVLTRRENI